MAAQSCISAGVLNDGVAVCAVCQATWQYHGA